LLVAIEYILIFMIKKELEKEIKKLVEVTLGLQDVEVVLDHPANEIYGDFTTSVALRVSRELHQPSKDIASRLVEPFYKSKDLIGLGVEKIETAGPGFINFYLNQEFLAKEVDQALSQKDDYGTQEPLKGTKIMVEFADPNPFKEFHIGHLRNISYGESLVRLYKALGADVWPVNYQGDVGLQVAKSLWGLKKLGYDKGRLENSGLNLVEKIKILGLAYVEGSKALGESVDGKKEIVAINVAVYNQDASQKELLELWRVGRSWSLEYFDNIYKRVGTSYRRYYFESEVAGPGRQLVLDHIGDGVFERSQEAVVFNGDRFGLHTRVFIAKEGYATYEAKDLYLAPLKYHDFPYDLSLILTGNEQGEYFKVVLMALSKVSPDLAAKTKNVTFGMVNLKGEKMTSRKGNVITAVSVIEDAKEAIKKLITSELNADELEEVSEMVAVGAVKYSMLRSDAKNDIAFDVAESIALEGNSGPYLQYTYARATSVLRKAGVGARRQAPGDLKLNVGGLTLSNEERSLLRTLYKFPEVVESAALQYSPHLLCNFLFDLAQKFNQFYNNVTILGSQKVEEPKDQKLEGEPATHFRLALTAAAAQVIKNGLYLLGIEAPERM
jgi:arginyl-tRNA synthetase